MQLQTHLFEDFCTFAKAHIESKDIDPVYPVLKALYEQHDLPQAIRIWRTILYVAVYDIGTAYTLWEQYPEPQTVSIYAPKTGIERRGFRGNALAGQNINQTLEQSQGDLEAWLNNAAVKGWDAVRQSFEAVPYNGNWASYKWADLVKHVLAYDIDATNIGVGGNGRKAGPIPGMVKLTGLDWKQCAQDVPTQNTLLKLSIDNGVPFAGLDQLETALCDFNSLMKGGYYIGHDIDSMMKHIPDKASDLWACREAVFDARFLGEINGWFGVRKDLKTLYKDQRILFL